MDKSTDEKILTARAEDAVRLCERQYAVKVVGFLTPAEAAVIKKNIHSSDAVLSFYGGYPDAERRLFVAMPEYAEEKERDELISVIEITGRNIGGLTHRDYLGSLLGLGIKREKLGDIIVTEERCLIFVLSDIADYIIGNLEKIGRCGVRVRLADRSEIVLPERRVERIETTVAALRLDCVTAAALKTSRSKALPYITAKKVSVNWEEKENPAAPVKAGDVLSIRGEGRFRLCEEMNETKKGRLGICIEKMK